MSYKIQTYKVGSNGWGYDIFDSSTLLIHQPSIPAIAGDYSFHSESEATAVGRLVIEKLEHHIFPPTLSIDEIQRLGVTVR